MAGKKLLIVESPTKIKTISKFLPSDFKVMSTMGHIMDLPTKKVGVKVTSTIDLEYVPLADKEKVITQICKAAATADEIYLAPDPDREGEIIAWHIEQSIAPFVKKKAKIYRIAFNEITKPAVLDALANPHEVDMQKVAAQQARRVLDRWVGYEVSPILWIKIAPGLSAGRVQSVALRMVAEREEAIRAFKPEESWSITGLFAHIDGKFEATLSTIGKEKADIITQDAAEKVVADVKKQNYIIDSITDKQRTKNPLPPFMTSSLQQAAFNKLGFSVKKTMQLAQQLYEGVPLADDTPIALITYMRTDSLRISETALTQARTHIKNSFSVDYLPKEPNVYGTSKNSKTQDAHEAIRPIDVAITPEIAARSLPKDLAKLYDLIYKRFIASQMTSARYAQRQVSIEGGKYLFKVTGSTLLFDGFLKVYNVEEDDEKEQKVVLPQKLAEKDPLNLDKITPKQHFTQPPPRYTEASLVKDLEKEGIGRPSTYGAILNTIRARAYTTVDAKKRFMPTELGMTVTKLLIEHLPKIMDIKFTAHMEEDLDKVAHGEVGRDILLRTFYEDFSQSVKKFKGKEGKRIAEATDITCPECGQGPLLIRFGKGGEFLGCSRYPECKFTSNFKRNEQGILELVKAPEPQILSEPCPQCGKPLRSLMGRYGPFIACSGYPECTYIHQEKAPFPCPADGGEIVKRKWRGGSFWGCKNYPKCKFAVFGEIELTPCPKCKAPFLVKKVYKNGTMVLACHNKECGFSESTKTS